MLCVHSQKPEVTRRLGEALGASLQPGDVVALSGVLGAGKTCLVQGIARGLGVDPALPVTSPTFTIVGEYAGRIPLRHADFYRVDGYERLFEFGFDDLMDGRGVLVVEWPELLPDALPAERIDVEIRVDLDHPGDSDSNPRRTICLSDVGQRARDLAAAVSGAWSERA